MNKDKKCVINYFSVGREDYKIGSERLVQTLILNEADVDILIWSPDFAESQQQILPYDNTLKLIKGVPTTEKYGECKPHKEEPYQFKSFCFQAAREMGYESILWCDSSIVVLKNPEHYFELAKEVGVILFDNQGCTEATWTSDDCLEAMGCDPEYAKTFFECDAGIMLLDFSSWKTNAFFNEYIKYCTDGICLNGRSGSSRPEFSAHRHDQSIASYIAKKHYINFINYGGWGYGGDTAVREGKYKPTFVKLGIQLPLTIIGEQNV